jgi:hypothetical protein
MNTIDLRFIFLLLFVVPVRAAYRCSNPMHGLTGSSPSICRRYADEIEAGPGNKEGEGI